MDRIDHHLLSDILSRLPIKTLARLQCTCQRWRRLISEPRFSLMQAQKSAQNVLGLLHVTVDQMGGSIVYLPLDANATDVPYTRRLGPRTSIVASCNGLLLCSYRLCNSLKYCVYNPTTGAHQVLPSNEQMNSQMQLGLVADPTAFSLSFYMVVGIELRAKAPNANVYGFKMLSSEKPKWRLSAETLSCRPCKFLAMAGPVFIRGALHWLTTSGDILAFHVLKERAWMIKIPEEVEALSIGGYSNVWFGLRDGLINLTQLSGCEMLVWVLGDYENVKWEMRKRFEIAGIKRGRRNIPLFYNGKHLAFASKCKEHLGFYVYNIQRKRTERIMISEGWMDRCRNFFPYISNYMMGVP